MKVKQEWICLKCQKIQYYYGNFETSGGCEHEYKYLMEV